MLVVLRPLRALLLAGLASGGCFHDSPPDFATGTSPTTGADPTTSGTSTNATGSTTGSSSTTGELSTGATQTATAAEPDLPSDTPFDCPVQETLVACYLFEDQGETFLDGSGNGWNGQRVGVDATDGHRGLGVATSSSSKLAVIDASGPVGGAEWTLMGWVRLDAYSPERAGVLDRDGDYGIFIDHNGFAMCTGGAMTLLATKFLPLQEWHHVACVRAGDGRMTLYLDGQKNIEGTLPISSPPAQSILELANDSPPSAAEALVGALDEVLLWSSALSPAELCLHAGLIC